MADITNKEEKKSGFWGASIFKKAKNLITGEGSEEEEDDVLNDSKNQVCCISYLDYVCKEIVNHVASNELVPILTHQKFHSLCCDKFKVGMWRKVVERHLLKTNRIKYSKATIEFDKGRYHKEYKVIRFINLDKLRGKKTDMSPTLNDPNKISELYLLLFELELNHSELKSGLVQVEGRKEFIEHNINVAMEEVPVPEDKKDKIKLEIKKLHLFDHVWMKLSQCVALIDEEFPRLQMYKASIPKDTIKMFVMETRRDLKSFEESVQYAETTTLSEIPSERIPKWFEDVEELTEEELELKFYTEFDQISEVDGLEQYDSIIDKLRKNIRNHTQSFYHESKGLDDSFIHSYNKNNRDYGQTMLSKKFSANEKIYRGSMIIQTGEDEGEEEVDVTEIFKSPL